MCELDFFTFSARVSLETCATCLFCDRRSQLWHLSLQSTVIDDMYVVAYQQCGTCFVDRKIKRCNHSVNMVNRHLRTAPVLLFFSRLGFTCKPLHYFRLKPDSVSEAKCSKKLPSWWLLIWRIRGIQRSARKSIVLLARKPIFITAECL